MPIALKKLLLLKRCAVVKRRRTTYMIQQGWELKGGADPHWEGWYKTPQGNFRGWIDQLARPRYCIYKPPEALQHHRHRSCFTDQKHHGWHTVHFATLPKDLDSGVLEIERILRQAFAQAKTTQA